MSRGSRWFLVVSMVLLLGGSFVLPVSADSGAFLPLEMSLAEGFDSLDMRDEFNRSVSPRALNRAVRAGTRGEVERASRLSFLGRLSDFLNYLDNGEHLAARLSSSRNEHPRSSILTVFQSGKDPKVFRRFSIVGKVPEEPKRASSKTSPRFVAQAGAAVSLPLLL